jgi:integral membrane protein
VSSAGEPASIRPALLRFRVIAYAVGIALVVLVVVGVPLRIWGDDPTLVRVLGPIHGGLYILYLIAAADLVRRVGWPTRTLLPIALAGVVPFLTLVQERRVTRRVQAERVAVVPNASG